MKKIYTMELEEQMTEVANIVDALKRIEEGDAWHGLSLNEILTDITAEQATAKPIPGVHSIWELVLHITGWEEAFSKRLQGKPMELPDDGDFPDIVKPDQESWNATRERLRRAHAQLIKIVSNLSAEDLEQKVPGKDYSIAFMLHGIIRHHVYHAGQIGLLKKSITSALSAITSGGETAATS